MRSDSTEERLADWFKPGVEPADVVALSALTRARSSVQAIISLFTGTEAAVLIRLLVLREVGARGAAPFWSAAELRARFPYLDEGKLDHLIGRLRVHGLLAWDADAQRYSVSPVGRMVIAALAPLLRTDEDGGDVGYLASQLAASGSMGEVPDEQLQFLLSRLVELKEEFERAILSGSEVRILAAERKLNSVWQYVDKASDVLREITENGNLSPEAHRVAQRIGQLQSELLRMSGAFQRVLNQLESQKVHLGATGLSSADVARWLGRQDRAALAKLAAGLISPPPQFAFALGDIALDVAEFELIDKLRPEKLDVPLPPSAHAPSNVAPDTDADEFLELERWRDLLRVAPDGMPLADAVPLKSYELSSYRLSLLALIGDRESAALDGPVADFARLERRLEWTGGVIPVGHDGVAEMSEGRLTTLVSTGPVPQEGLPRPAGAKTPRSPSKTAKASANHKSNTPKTSDETPSGDAQHGA